LSGIISVYRRVTLTRVHLSTGVTLAREPGLLHPILQYPRPNGPGPRALAVMIGVLSNPQCTQVPTSSTSRGARQLAIIKANFRWLSGQPAPRPCHLEWKGQTGHVKRACEILRRQPVHVQVGLARRYTATQLLDRRGASSASAGPVHLGVGGGHGCFRAARQLLGCVQPVVLPRRRERTAILRDVRPCAPSPGADVGWASPVPAKMWQDARAEPPGEAVRPAGYAAGTARHGTARLWQRSKPWSAAAPSPSFLPLTK